MYKVIYKNGTSFTGGPLDNSGWLNVKDGIKEVRYSFPKKLSISGYEEYNHLVEKEFINGRLHLVALLLMGKTGDNIDVKKLNLSDGTVTEYTVNAGKEYNGGPTTGWKKG